METAKSSPPSQSTTADVWSAAFARRANEWELPIVDLRNLGLIHDEDGFISSEFLIALTPGAEAQPYLDSDTDVVYKLFDLRLDGSLGKKLEFNFGSEGFEVDVADATLIDTIEKLLALNAGGGLPTELIGLASSFDYLLAKQPRAYDYENFSIEREQAVRLMRGVYPIGGGLRQHLIVSQIDSEFWLVGDLHERNIMRDSSGRPTIIDALTGKITPLSRKKLNWLNHACRDAQEFRETGTRPKSSFDEVDDDEL